MKRGLRFIALLIYFGAEVRSLEGSDLDPLKGLIELNPAQQQVVINYIQRKERPTGELKVLADRGRIAVRSSEVLRELFPEYRFVVIPWRMEASPETVNKFAIPGGLFDTLALTSEGSKVFVFHSSGNAELYADFLCAQQIRIVSEQTAAMVARAFSEIYEIGVGSRNLRRGDSQWLLGYQEFPFRSISSYEEVREASYYLVEIDSSGLVLCGRLVTDTLERRKIHSHNNS